jgi:hypothetical protein
MKNTGDKNSNDRKKGDKKRQKALLTVTNKGCAVI